MRHVPFDLPEMALTDHATTRVKTALGETGGYWFCAEDGQRAVWSARFGAADAFATNPEPGLSEFGDWRGVTALKLQTGINGGFVFSEELPDPTCWSAALIWASGEDPARALLALRGPGGGNYLYLQETPDRRVELRDDAGRSVLTGSQTTTEDGWQMTLISCADGGLCMSTSVRETLSTPAPDDLPVKDVSLLIGCRSHRPGLKKTLGAGRIRDLFFWPGRNLLAETPTEAARDMRAAFDHFCLWER